MLCLWAIVILTSDSRMSSLLQLEKENLLGWCQSMVSSRASLIHVFIWCWLFIVRFYYFANCITRFFFFYFRGRNVLSLDEHASYFENIDPVSQYKRWTTRQISNRNSHSLPVYNISSEGVKGAFVVSDPVDWGRVIQVLSHSVCIHACWAS